MFKRLWRVVEGFFALFVRGLEKSSPKALLEAEIVALDRAVAQYNMNLARQAGLIERLKGQITRQTKQVDLLTAKTTACYNTGQTTEAGRYAFEVKTVRQELMENEEQLSQAEEMYKNLTRQRDVFVKEARRKIEAIQAKLSKAEMAESQARLAEISSATAFDIAGSGSTLDRIEQDVEDRLTMARGKVRVSQDSMQGSGFVMKEEEQRALEQMALQEFAAGMGLPARQAAQAAGPDLTAPAPAPSPTKEIGPQDSVKTSG